MWRKAKTCNTNVTKEKPGRFSFATGRGGMWLTEVKNASSGFFLLLFKRAKSPGSVLQRGPFERAGATVSTGSGSTGRRSTRIAYSQLQTLGGAAERLSGKTSSRTRLVALEERFLNGNRAKKKRLKTGTSNHV